MKRLIFTFESGAQPALSDGGQALHSGSVSDTKHGGIPGYVPENAFNDGGGWWGGRQSAEKDFFIGITCAKPEKLRSVQLSQGDTHYAKEVTVERYNIAINRWEVMHSAKLKHLGEAWTLQTLELTGTEEEANPNLEANPRMDAGEDTVLVTVTSLSGESLLGPVPLASSKTVEEIVGMMKPPPPKCVWQLTCKERVVGRKETVASLETKGKEGPEVMLQAVASMNVSTAWRLRAQTTQSGWAWDVRMLVFTIDSGAQLQLQDCEVLHSGSVSDPQHGGIGGYEPENMFRGNNAWWGGRQGPDGTFFIGLRSPDPVSVSSVTLSQGDTHCAGEVTLECLEPDNGSWRAVHTEVPKHLGTWTPHTFEVGA